jgi:hypothetical protein
MIRCLLILVFLILPRLVLAAPENGCNSHEDCLAVAGACANSWVPVNKSHEKETREKIAKMRPQIECFTPQSRGVPPAAVCENNICILEAEKSPK